MIKVGLVGFGGMGKVHFHNYKEIEGVEVTGIVTESQVGKEEAEKLGVAHFGTIKELVEHIPVDVIDICTPTFLHKPQVMEALSFDKHVIVEKPMALHKADAEEMYALAESKNRFLFVAQVLRFTKDAQILKDIVTKGTLGKPLDAHFERVSGKPSWSQGGWLFDKEKSGQVAFDLHIHDLDLMVSTFGKPRKFSFTSNGRNKEVEQEQYRITYEYDGFTVCAETAWYHADYPFTQRFRIYFEEGVLEQEKGVLTLYQKDRKPVVYDTKDEVLVSTGINLPPTGMFYNELSHFMDCIRKGEPSRVIEKSEIISSIEILEKIVFGT